MEDERRPFWGAAGLFMSLKAKAHVQNGEETRYK